MSCKRVFAIAAVLAGLGGSAAFAQANSTAPADSKSVTAPKPAAEEKPDAKTTDAKTTDAKTADAKPAETKKHSRAEVEAFLTKCSQEADEKGLDVKKGKGAERKAYRRECMKKFGVVAK